MIAIVHKIYEYDDRGVLGKRPVAIHVFLGDTQQEAEGIHRAHREADSFLRGIEDSGRYKNVRGTYTIETVAA